MPFTYPPLNYKEKNNNTNTIQAPGESENEHTTEKLGSLSQDPDTDPEPNTGATGKWDQTIGSAKESLGNLIGNEDLRKSGIDQNQSGKAQEAKAQLQDLSQGAADRAQGALGTVSAVMTGDRDAEERYRRIHDEGKARQRAAEADIENKGSY